VGTARGAPERAAPVAGAGVAERPGCRLRSAALRLEWVRRAWTGEEAARSWATPGPIVTWSARRPCSIDQPCLCVEGIAVGPPAASVEEPRGEDRHNKARRRGDGLVK
jgi:hypothetical protein